MTDVPIDHDELVLLSPVWCDAMKINIGEAGVLVSPVEVKEFLVKAFVRERGKWHGPRRAICAAFEIPEMHEDPYKALIQQRGPAFMSIKRVCDPAGDEDLRVAAQNPRETKDYEGFKTYRATKIIVSSQVDLKQVVSYVYASLKKAEQVAQEQREKQQKQQEEQK